MIIEKYKDTMTRIIQLYYPFISKEELSPILDYSIQKRYRENTNVEVVNTYKNTTNRLTLLAVAEYIASKEPIVTSYGTMFKKKGTIPNPLTVVVEQFLNARGIHKKEMFKYPKGSEEFEHYNLLQQLDKIDTNGLYGCIGMYTSAIYNINVATSITSQGRTSVSTMMLFFESFLSNNAKFGSLDEVLQFIDNVINEKSDRKFNDAEILDENITPQECFAKLVYTSGFRWVPDNEELEIIWRIVNNLGGEDLNRVYYKNNLYNFCENKKISRIIVQMIKDLRTPYYEPAKCPKEIQSYLDYFTALLKEYVYYPWMYADRIEKAENMIKNICVISDTDSTIISLDAWYHFVLDMVKYEDLHIKKWVPDSVFEVLEKDEFGDYTNKSQLSPFVKVDPEYDYDFENDELIELKHVINPFKIYPEDNLRFSIINIICYVLDKLVNDYMEQQTKRNFSYDKNYPCRMFAKNECLFKRVLLTEKKKNYASIQELQEGNMIPKNKQLDIKGIESMAKSNTAESTKAALKKILLEDIMNTPTVDQFKIIKDIAILEKKMIDSVLSGSKEFYKPAKIKSQSNYDNPFRIQGVKAAYAWNKIKPSNLPAINLDERNAIDIAKTDITLNNIDCIKNKYPEVYENIKNTLLDDNNLDKDHKIFRGSINAVAIPLELKVPDWLIEFIDYKTIINNNISGFTFESVGIQRMHKNSVNYTNILQL